MRATRLGKAGRADRDHVGVAEQAAQIDILVGQHALERDVVVAPNRDFYLTALTDFGDLAAQQRLRRVDMGVYQARHGDLAGSVDRRFSRHPPLGGRCLADPEDPVALDRDRAVADHAVLAVDGDDVAAAQQQIDFLGLGVALAGPLLSHGAQLFFSETFTSCITEKSASLSTSGSLSRPEALAAAYIGPAMASRSSTSNGWSGLAGFLSMAYCSSFCRGCCLGSRPRSAPYLVTTSFAAPAGPLPFSVHPRPSTPPTLTPLAHPHSRHPPATNPQ